MGQLRLGKESAEGKAMRSPARPSPRVPGVEPDLPLPGLRAGEQEGVCSLGKEIPPAACVGWGRLQGGFASLAPSAPRRAVGVGTNSPILPMRRLRWKLCKAESSPWVGAGLLGIHQVWAAGSGSAADDGTRPSQQT